MVDASGEPDRRCDFMQQVFSGVSDIDVNLLDFAFRLFPIYSDFDLSAHAPLVTDQALLMFFEAVERHDEAFVAHGGEPSNTNTMPRRSFP